MYVPDWKALKILELRERDGVVIRKDRNTDDGKVVKNEKRSLSHQQKTNNNMIC